MSVTRIGELVVIGWKLLQTLHRNSAEVSRKCGVLSEHHGAPGNKAVYQRLRPHLWRFDLFSNEPRSDMLKFQILPWKQCRQYKNISNIKIKPMNYGSHYAHQLRCPHNLCLNKDYQTQGSHTQRRNSVFRSSNKWAARISWTDFWDPMTQKCKF